MSIRAPKSRPREQSRTSRTKPIDAEDWITTLFGLNFDIETTILIAILNAARLPPHIRLNNLKSW
jgi:hypothetical protein